MIVFYHVRCEKYGDTKDYEEGWQNCAERCDYAPFAASHFISDSCSDIYCKDSRKTLRYCEQIKKITPFDPVVFINNLSFYY